MKENVKTSVKQILTDYLEKNKFRKTPERYAILDAIYSFKGHFTLTELGNKIFEDSHFQVSRATLYNAINLFMELGLVARHKFLGETKFEACYADNKHNHQICTMCGKVTEFKSQAIANAIDELKLNRFRKEGYFLYVYGICSVCQGKLTRRKAIERKNKL